jgi:hypothetical protein
VPDGRRVTILFSVFRPNLSKRNLKKKERNRKNALRRWRRTSAAAIRERLSPFPKKLNTLNDQSLGTPSRYPNLERKTKKEKKEEEKNSRNRTPMGYLATLW